MVAVVSGSGLGLFNSSASTTGLQDGDPGIGRGNDRAYVNTANGNLIIQSTDDFLTGNGLDTALVRTYNSQGLVDGDNDDGWRVGFYRRVILNGPLGDEDSTVTKIFGDGSEVIYRFEAGKYVSTDGDGAHDTLSFAAGVWTWTDGSLQMTETYDGDGRITTSRDANNNTIQYGYTGNLLTSVTDASYQQMILQYEGNNLKSVRVVSLGQEQTLNVYSYDSQGRLVEAAVDYTWNDGTVADRNAFVTTYKYVGTTNLIEETVQRSGMASTVLASQKFTYVFIGGLYRVKTVTDAEGRTTTFDYTLTSNSGGLSTTFATVNAGQLLTTDTQFNDVPYPRNNGALTTPTAGLAGAALLETANGVVIEPKVAFDSNGNGFAVWAQGGDVFARRYTRVNDTWAAAVTLDTNGNTASAPTLALDAAGNAVVAWSQSNGSAVSAYGVTYNATTGAWGTTALLESTNQAVATTAYSVSASISGTQAAVAFLQTDGTRNNAYVARWNGTSWSAATLVEARTDVAAQPSVAVDSLGNVSVVIQQSNGTANSVYVNRYTASSATWSGASLLETSNTAVIEPKVAFDANGNGFAIWSQGADVFARRYTRSTNTWAAAVTLDSNGNTSSAPSLSVDASGNAVAAWAQSNGSAVSAYAAYFNATAGTWGSATLLESTNLAVATTAYSISTSIKGNRAAVAWLQTDGTRNNAYLSRWDGSGWSGAALAESRTDVAAQPSVAIDALGNAVVAIQQSNGSANSLYLNRYIGDTTPYRQVASGDSWRTIANAVYGIDSDAAGQELSEQLVGQSIVLGNRLTGFPPTLNVPTATTVNVPAYYLVLVTDSWGDVTDKLYGTRDPNAILALQGATGTTILSANLHLTVPTTLRYTPSGQVSITAGNPLVSTTDNVTTSQQYALLPTGPTNSAVVGWQPAAALENRASSPVGQYPRVSLNANGDGFAVWGEATKVYARRFDAASQSWTTETVVDEVSNSQVNSFVDISVDAAGNAVAVWIRWSSATSSQSTYASVFSVATGTWGPATVVLPSNSYVNPDNGQKLVKMVAGRAAISYTRTVDGAQSIFVKRYVGGVWSAEQLVETSNRVASSPGINLDDAGNITVTWLQSDGTRNQVYSNRWLIASSSFSGATAITNPASPNETPTDTQLAGDAQGNLYAAWRTGLYFYTRVFDASTGTWLATNMLAFNVSGYKIVSDAAGNAAVAWMQSTGVSPAVVVSRYNRATGTWSTPDVLGTISGSLTSYQIKVEIQGENVAVSWDDTNYVTFATFIRFAIFRDGVWSAPQDIGQQTNTQSTSWSMDAAGNISFVEQRNPMAQYPSAFATRFNAPSYTIPSGASWRSIANALYGVDSVAAGNALRDKLGNPPILAGNRLTNLPTRLTIETTASATVLPYYVVQAGDTWSSIAQAIYGTTSARIAETLRRATGDPVLGAGLHLTLPGTLYYGSDTIYLQTDVTNSLGAVDTYVRDAQGRLTSHRSPTVDGVRVDDRYEYDGDGNLTRIIQDFGGLNRITDLGYDDNGNLTGTWDSLGNATKRTYDQWNQLLTVTRYTGTDPDGSGAVVAAGAMTTHYVYNTTRNLRFIVSADQRVTEYRYNGLGLRTSEIVYPGTYTGNGHTEFDLEVWKATQNLSLTQRTDYQFDTRGNVSYRWRYETLDASGYGNTQTTSPTSFQYDQRGRNSFTWTPVGSAFIDVPDSRSYSNVGYDIFGNVSSVSNRIDTYAESSEYRFDEFTNTQSLTEHNYWYTPTTPPTYSIINLNRAGQAASVTRRALLNNALVLETTSLSYDAAGRLRMTTNSLGVRTYVVYDAMGRKVADIDGEGRISRYFYNHANEVIKTISYSSALDAEALATLIDAQGKPAEVSIDTLVGTLSRVPGRDASLDQISRAVYDAAGRLVYTIDGLGGVVQTRYDGAGRVVGTTAYANPLSVSIDPSAGEVLVSQLAPGGAYAISPDTDDDRNTRNFFDGDGNLRATLDGEGYLTEYKYDGAGRLIEQVGYANPTPESERAAGTLDSLRPAADLPEHTDDPESDIRSYFFYDLRGRRVGEVDGKGYLTESVYDGADNLAQVIRYEKSVTVATNSTLGTLRSAATGVNRSTSYRYDGMGRVVQTTNYEGTVTRLKLDPRGNVLSTTIASGTSEARTTQKEVDAFGRVTRELSAEGSAAIAGGMNATTAWSQYSVRYLYDNVDHLVATIDPNGSRTLFYYDKSGNVRFTVRDMGDGTGELSEVRYNGLGQSTLALNYSARISMATLAGGLVNDTILNLAVSANASGPITFVNTTYRKTGEVASVIDAVGATTTLGYNAFGEVTSEISTIEAGRDREHSYDYDRRGLRTFTAWEPLGINRTQDVEYDAFGRQTSVTDQYGNVASIEYDTLGRILTSTDTLGRSVSSTYDAFSRVRTTTDALLNETSYEYDDAARSVKVTTPEGIIITTVHYRDGQAFTVSDSLGAVTTYQYDANGQLKSVSDTLGTMESRTYDIGGRLQNVVDGRNVTTRLGYDAANRLLTRTQDFGGLALQTVYEYDGQGRVIRVTEPGNRVTRTTYYDDGQVHEVIVDEGGLALRTEYFYDLTKNIVAVTENADGVGANNKPRRTEYVYDDLGQRTHQIVDPTSFSGSSALNLDTEFRYDRNGNITRKIDAEQHSTWYVYDDGGQLLQTIDALGGVTELEYDDEGRVVLTRRHANSLNAASFQNVDIVAFQTVPASNQDRVTRSVYDAEGRERFTISTSRVYDGTIPATEYGVVTERTFDDHGNVTSTRVHDQEILVPSDVTEQAIDNLVAPTSGDRLQTTIYDLRDRAIFLVDVYGGVTRQWFDGAGNLVRSTSYVTQTAVGLNYTELDTWATAHDADAGNRTTRFWYDAVGRARFSLDAEGYLRETRYLDSARQEINVTYADRPSFDGTATITWIEQHLPTDVQNDRKTTTTRDGAGRIVLVEQVLDYENDSASAVTLSEHYTYDGLGNKRTYQNAKNDIWTYVYDANGRLKDEISPQVWVTTITDVNGTLTPSREQASIITRMTYDHLGNVHTRTEGIRLVNGIELTNGSRTTTYDYDLLGRQTTVTHPDVMVYNGGPSDATTNIGVLTQQVETSVTPKSITTYNALGDAVMNVDVANARSRKVYDSLGRVKYEVDALGYVTEYGFDVFGNVQTVKRYAQKIDSSSLSSTAVWSATDISGGLHSTSDDRTITNEYDLMNRRTRVLQPQEFSYTPANGAAAKHSESAIGRTDFEYNAFGEVRLEKRLLDSVTGQTADTRYFYDREGRRTYTLDALGYVTQDKYDARGNVSEHIEYSRKLATSANGDPSLIAATTHLTHPDYTEGYDRRTSYFYDSLDRMRLQRTYEVEAASGDYIDPNNDTVFGTQDITFGYDAVGNRTSTTDAYLATTFTYYDKLGRIRAMTEPVRDADADGDFFNNTNFVPLVELNRDVFGNLVEQVRYGASATLSNGDYTAPTGGATQWTRMVLDPHGRTTRSQDSTLASRYFSYTVRGDIAKEWQIFKDVDNKEFVRSVIHEYDALGREVTIIEPQRRNDTVPVERPTAVVVRNPTWYDGGPAWLSHTIVDLSWADLGTNDPVYIILMYTRQDHQLNAGDTHSQSIITTGARTGWEFDWQDAGSGNGGVHSIDRILVYTANGQTLLRDSWGTAVAQPSSNSQIAYVQTKYNAFGEMIARGVNPERLVDSPTANYQEYWVYDRNGRVWKTNADDGVDRVYLYDVAGRNTAEIRSKGNGVIPDAPTQTSALNNANTMRTEQVFDALDHIVVQRAPELEVDTALDPAISDAFLNVINGEPTLYWTGTVNPNITVTFEYFNSDANTWIEVPVIQVSPTQLGVKLTGLDGPTFQYRVSLRKALQFNPYARTRGTFHFNETRVVTIDQFTRIAPEAEIATLAPDFAGAIITWAAPADTSINAVMRFQRQGTSTWTNVDAIRVGNNFVVDARSVLTAEDSYGYQIVYDRNNYLIALNTGGLSVGATTYTRNFTTSGSLNTTAQPPDTVIPEPTASGTGANRTLTWTGPAGNAEGTFVVDVKFRHYPDASYSAPVRLTHNGSGYSLNVASLDINPAPYIDGYDYDITYKVGERILSEQIGHFFLTDAQQSNTVGIEVWPGMGYVPTPPIPTVTGTDAGQNVSWSELDTQYVYEISDDGAFISRFYWGGANSVRPTWTGSQNSAWVVIDYMTLGDNYYGTYGSAYSESVQVQASGTMTRNTLVNFSAPNAGGAYGSLGGNIGPAGASQILRMRVYTSQGGTLIADSSNPVAAGRGLRWDAPADDTNFAAKVSYSNGASWVYLGDATRTSNVFTISAESIPTGRQVKIEYVRPGQTWAFNTLIADFTMGPSGAPTLANQSPSNHDPAMLGLITGGMADGRLYWEGAVVAGGNVTLETKMPSGDWTLLQQWTSGSSFSYDFTSIGSTTPPMVEYRIKYTGPSTAGWVYMMGQGIFYPRRTVIDLPATVTYENSMTFPYKAIVVVPHHTGAGLEWTQARGAPENTIRLSYWRLGQQIPYVQYLTGDGPTYSSNFPGIENTGGSVTVYWELDYFRPNETNSFARARGQTTANASTSTIYPNVHINFQYAVFPSGLAEIPLLYQDPTNPNILRWTMAPSNGATVSIRINGNSFLPLADNMGVDITTLPSNLPGETYEYDIMFIGQNATTAYARGRATFHLQRSTTLQNLQVQRFSGGGAYNTAPSDKRTLDRWGNVIAYVNTAGQETLYRYNVFGLLATTRNPQANILDTRPEDWTGVTGVDGRNYSYTESYYDLMGRAIASRDENRNVNGVTYNTAGQKIAEWHADGGSKQFLYDGLGRQTQVTDELEWRSRTSYDSANREIQRKQEYGADAWLTRDFTYDSLGNLTSETSGALAIDNTPEKTVYYYDLSGHIIRRRSEMGADTRYKYDLLGHKTEEVDPLLAMMTWDYDRFGRVQSHMDLGGATTNYFYNGAGLLDLQTSSRGQSLNYEYDSAGNVRTIIDQAEGRSVLYAYDYAGRRAVERTLVDNVVHQDVQIGYDERGRIAQLADLRYALTYSYDAVGNRTKTSYRYLDHELQPHDDVLDYTYDEMNRVTSSTGNPSVTYDKAGQRKTATMTGPYWVGERASGELYYAGHPGYQNVENRQYTETYNYDGAGRLYSTFRTGANSSGQAINREVEYREYDGASRLIRLDDKMLRVRTRYTYNDDGYLTHEVVRWETSTVGDFQDIGPLQAETTYTVDAVGVQRSYVADGYKRDPDNRALSTISDHFTYTNEYRVADSYLLTKQSLIGSKTGGNNPGPYSGKVERFYDVNNQVVKIFDDSVTEDRQYRYLANNLEGETMTAIEGNFADDNAVVGAFNLVTQGGANPWFAQHFFHANGKYVGSFGQLHAGNAHDPSQFSANFDTNFTPMSANFPAPTPGNIVAQEGDTLRSIAGRLFGDPGLWYLLAEENGRTQPDELIPAGTTLRVPNNVYSLANTSEVFKPFDVNEAIGDKVARPHYIGPPHEVRVCGMKAQTFLQVLSIVVTMIASYFLPGSGTFLNGAISAALGNAAAQGAAMWLGIQDEFDWKSLGKSALYGGIGAAVTPAISNMEIFANTPVLGSFVGGAVGNAVSQGAAILLDLQDSFDWTGVASAGVSNAVATKAGMMFDDKFNGKDSFVKDFSRSLFTGTTSAVVSSVFGGKVDMISILTNSFGTALANSVARQQSGPPEPEAFSPGRRYQTAEEQLAEVAETSWRDSSLENNPDEGATSQVEPPTPDDVAEVTRSNGGPAASKSEEMQVIVVAANPHRSRRSVLTYDSYWIDRLRITQKMYGDDDKLMAATHNRFVDHLEVLRTINQTVGLASDTLFGYEEDAEAVGIATDWLKDKDSREAILTMSGVQEEDLKGLELRDQLEMIAEGSLENLELGVTFGEKTMAAGLGHLPNSLEHRFLQLYAKDFEGAGQMGLVASLANATKIGFMMADSLRPSLQLDVNAVAMAARVGILPVGMVSDVAKEATDTLYGAYADFVVPVIGGALSKASGRIARKIPWVRKLLGAGTDAIEATLARTSRLLYGFKPKVMATAMKVSRRIAYMGRTPGKNSAVGKIVQQRMEDLGLLKHTKAGTLVKHGDDWLPIEQFHMGHIEDAVNYWNRRGRFFGARSDDVTKFMNNADNYILEYGRTNMSRGAKIGAHYLPPASGEGVAATRKLLEGQH